MGRGVLVEGEREGWQVIRKWWWRMMEREAGRQRARGRDTERGLKSTQERKRDREG